jgi:hypothetical protein
VSLFSTCPSITALRSSILEARTANERPGSLDVGARVTLVEALREEFRGDFIFKAF